MQLNIIVQKFGGTSMANLKSREKVVEKIITKLEQEYKVLVVVSAMGRRGDSYSTDSLIELVQPKAIGKRELDLLLSCGEIISSVVLANHLALNGYSTFVLSGLQAGILTDNNFGNANIIKVNPNNILNRFKQYKTLIVTGFQGATKDGDITTLGRGGSDITAIALAQAIKSPCVEIYTDVDGVMTADPNVSKDAKIIESITYIDLYNLARTGAKIIHPKAVKMAQDSKIPLIIRNTFNNNPGTYVGY